MDPYKEHVNPHLGQLLERLNMNKVFITGKGCRLYDRENRPYLDMIASYGALPFGYNPVEIWESIKEVEQNNEPSFIQPSSLNAAGELARILISIAPEGLDVVTFANSGAETAEAAIKLCRAATGRKGILAAYNSFHGKTLGALSATGKSHYQQVFGAPVEGFHYIPYGDAEALQGALIERPDYYAAFIVEPIQGEGGIIVPPAGYLKEVRDICARHSVPLVLDEIQTGLGRTGLMFACEEEGVAPDVMLVAKALSGGIVPIGACLCKKSLYTEDFALKHSSTFASNTLACRVGIAAIKKILANDGALIKNAASCGFYLKDQLLRLREKYPRLIGEVRGKGLMLGISFNISRETFPKSMLGVMAEQELLTPVISSYLLNVQGVRYAPTLNGSSVLRIEPPLIITREECDQALFALEQMLDVLAAGSTAHFLGYLINKEFPKTPGMNAQYIAEEKPLSKSHAGAGRFAFLVHPVDIYNYSEFDESLSCFNENELQELVSRLNDMVEPFVISSVQINSPTGETAVGDFISIPRTAEELLELPQEQVMRELRAAIDLGIKRGAQIIGLGAYTSVVSKAGRLLLDTGASITTGNSYTVVAAVEAVTKAALMLNIKPERTAAAVVGASGAIGRAVSMLLAGHARQLILLGNPKWPVQSRRRLLRIAAETVSHLTVLAKEGYSFSSGTLAETITNDQLCPEAGSTMECFLEYVDKLEGRDSLFLISTSIDNHLPLADMVICATSSPQTLVTTNNLKYGAIVCDISRPSNVSPHIRDKRPDVLLFDGGIIELPGRPSLGWNFGFEEGLAFACMAETILLTLEHHYEHTSIGTDLNFETLDLLRRLSRRHNFKVAEFRSGNRPLSSQRWKELLQARRQLEKQPSINIKY